MRIHPVQQIKIACIFILLMLMSVSCDRKEAYLQYNQLPDAQWGRLDTLCFNIDSSSLQLDVPYQVTIEVASNTTYQYQNLWLSVQDNFKSAKQLDSATEQYLLADKTGKWTGVGFGYLYQLSLQYKNRVVFTKKRNYKVLIEHDMRDQILSGVEKIGVKISKIT